jgi:hypothetical protein
MKRKETLVDLLDALWNRSSALLSMQIDIEDGDFECAMDSHFGYLYWNDEVFRLLRLFCNELDELMNAVLGFA